MASKEDGPAKLDAARKALLCDRSGVRQMAFKLLQDADKPENVVKTALDAYEKVPDLAVIELTAELLDKQQDADWVVPHLKKIRAIGKTLPQFALENCFGPLIADGALKRIDANKRWNELNATAHTPAEKKAAALKALTDESSTMSDESHRLLQTRAVDYLITLSDQALTPIWVQGILTDKRIRVKLVTLGKQAVPELIGILDVKHEGGELARASAAVEILAQIKDKRALPVLTSLMQLADQPGKINYGDLRLSARLALQEFGADGIRALTKVLNESANEYAVIQAAIGLRVVGSQADSNTLEARLAREKAKARPSDIIVDEIKIAVDGLREKLQSGEGGKE